MAENIHRNKHEAGKMKITVTNFQKIDDEIKTGFQSTCEIDFEVLSTVYNRTVNYIDNMKFSLYSICLYIVHT